jgi:hypothetical protein
MAVLQRIATFEDGVAGQLRRLYPLPRDLLPKDFLDEPAQGHPAQDDDPASLYSCVALGFTFDTGSLVQFRYQHVEQLLDQAADLLERGIRTREEWREKATRRFNVAIALAEYEKINRIRQQEIDAGVLEAPVEESEAELAGESSGRDAHTGLARSLREIRSVLLSGAERDRQVANAKDTAHISAWPVFGENGQFTPITQPRTVSDVNVSVATGGMLNRPNILESYARSAAEHSFALQSRQINAEEEYHSGLAGAVDERIAGLRAKVKGAKAHETFEVARDQVALLLNDLKAHAFQAPGGALNYSEQMAPMRARFAQDFQEALHRIVHAAKGLELLYGYTEPFPPALIEILPKAESGEGRAAPSDACFDFSLNWVRQAISFKVGFGQLEQNYVLALSVKEHLANGVQFNDPKAEGDELVWRCEVPEERFRGQSHVRLRGVSIFVEAEGNSVYHAAVRPPTQSISRHLGASSLVSLPQGDLPLCRAGRVRSRDSARDPDVVGLAALYNASPIGEWEIRISVPGRPASELKAQLSDVFLDLHLAVRSEVEEGGT